MISDATVLTETTRRLGELVARLEGSVLGQPELVRGLVIGVLAGGHVLIEGVPGLAKTRAVRVLAHALGLPFRRIQFTPDLLPADLIGTQVYLPATGQFEARPGPVVTNVLLADEINRAPAKVQSALLEAMQEHQVTIGDTTITLPDPFFVLATQNPIEHEGTYPLPEAQLDRFLMKIRVDYPDRAAELRILDLPNTDGAGLLTNVDLNTGWTAEAVRSARFLTTKVHLAEPLKAYLVDLVRATRVPQEYGREDLAPFIELGASPRATLALQSAARAHGFLDGRDYATPHDVKSVALPVLRHRLIASFEGEAKGLDADGILKQILETIRVP